MANYVSVITGKMDKDDPDSILEAILLTELNGVLCAQKQYPKDPEPCSDCAKIWAAIDYRLQKDTCPECHFIRSRHAAWCDSK